MKLMILLALLQNPADTVRFTSIYEKPFNDTLMLSLSSSSEAIERRRLLVSLFDRRSRRKVAGTLVHDQYVEQYGVLRFDDSSIVISRRGFYEEMPRLKLFLHPQGKVVLKRIDYQPDIGLAAVDDREVARVLETTTDVVQQLERKPWETKRDSSHIPKQLREHPLRVSTYREFASARAERVRDGYYEDGTTLEEGPGAYQFVGPRIWFGKVFYDGEGHTGVGGFGYFDTTTSRYTMLDVPGLADWSVSAILVEEDAAWLGLSRHPEGEVYGGGLLRYDFRTRKTRHFPVKELVYQIVRSNDRVYVATKNGAYQVQGTTLTRRYRVEPDIDYGFILVAEDLNAK